MKNLKKVLALVLAMALSFTMFAGAVAFDDVEIGSDYSAAISMLSDLEVISGDGKGNYNPNGTITRAEACVLIANIMNGGKADTARFAGGSNFSDVAHGWWGESAIAYCVQNGVTYGVGGGKFAPNREITDAEFVAMVTRAMGYDTAANPLSFPYGNYTAAVNNDLLDNVPYAEGSDCTRGEAAQILYDALFADYARLTANLNVIHNSDDTFTKTLIKDVFGLVDVKEVEVIDYKSCTEKNTIVTIDGSKYDCTADVSALIGYEVVLWVEADDLDDVKAIELCEGQKSYAYNPTMDVEDDLGLKADKWLAEKTVYGYGKTGLTDNNGNSYVLIDWNDNGKIDYVVATIREYYEVKAVTSKLVKLNGTAWEPEFDGKADFDGHEVVCEVPADIAKGDIVEIVYTACDYEETVAVAMSIVEPTTKEVTEVKAKGHKVYFDDEHLVVADKFFDKADEKYDAIDDSDDEYTWDVWQDANGYILKLAEPSESYAGYLLVLGQDDGSVATGNRHNAELDVYYDDNTSAEDVKVAKDATVTMWNGTEQASVYNKDTREFTPSLVGSAFKYQIEDGEITKLVQVAYNKAETFSYDDDAEMMTIGDDKAWMDDTDVVFVVKGANSTQLKAKDVKAVEYTALPSINKGETVGNTLGYTKAAGTKMSLTKAVVIFVDTFKYFDDITTSVVLVTDVSYKPSTDKWTVKAIVAGEGLTTFTAKEGTLDEGTVNVLSAYESALDTYKMIWAEIEFTDGVLSDIDTLSDTTDRFADEYDEFDAADEYAVARVALNHYTNDTKKVSVTELYKSNAGKVAPALSTDVFATLKITDATEFFVIDDDGESVPVFPATEGTKLATTDGYTVDSVDEIAFSTALNSYLDDATIEDGEYQVADVLVNKDGEIVMIFFFEELVEAETYVPATSYVVTVGQFYNKVKVTVSKYIDGEFDSVYNAGNLADSAFAVSATRMAPDFDQADNELVPVDVTVTKGDVDDFGNDVYFTAEGLQHNDEVTVTVTIDGVEYSNATPYTWH